MSQYAIDVTDTIQINAPKELVYRELANYPGISKWFPGYTCEFLDGAQAIAPGVQVRHTLKNAGITLSDFVRIIQKVQPGERIEETYDRGSMTGRGTWTLPKKTALPPPTTSAKSTPQAGFSKSYLPLQAMRRTAALLKNCWQV